MGMIKSGEGKEGLLFICRMSAGEIVSRLCYDADAMIAPASDALATFLSAAAVLLGSLISMLLEERETEDKKINLLFLQVCLYTSWRLSVLAFTTVGPIALMYLPFFSFSSFSFLSFTKIN